APMISRSTRTRPASSRRSNIPSCSANGPARRRTLLPILRFSPRQRKPFASTEAIMVSTTPRGTGCGMSPPPGQPGNAEGAVDAAPAMPRQIETNEQIAREERSVNIGQLAGVAHGLEPPRQKDFVRLVFQLAFGAQLAMRLGLHGVPASTILDRRG